MRARSSKITSPKFNIFLTNEALPGPFWYYVGMSEQERFRTDEEKLRALELDRQETLLAQREAELADDKGYAPNAEQIQYPDRKVSEIDEEIARRKQIKEAREAIARADAPDYDRAHPDTADPADTEHLDPNR